MKAVILCLSAAACYAFHDCVQQSPVLGRRLPGRAAITNTSCSGGLCVGMHDGPHEGGSSAYPVKPVSVDTATKVSSTMTVPDYPEDLSGITYYIWTGGQLQ